MYPVMSFSIGLAIGILLSVAVYYWIPYRRLKTASRASKEQLVQQQEELARYKARVGELEDEMSLLTGQLHNEQQQWDEQQQLWQEERGDLLMKRAERESVAFLEQTLPTPDSEENGDATLHWQQERQNWISENQRLNSELDQIREEKEGLEIGLQQATERRKKEREELQQELSATKQQIEQLQLRNQAFQDELKGLESTASGSNSDSHNDRENELNKRLESWRRERRTLHLQITKIQADKKALEADLTEKRVQAEKERQALEEEIEQLMERMLKLQMENESHSS